MSRRLAALLGVALLLPMSEPARATIIDLSYTGVVSSGYDVSGVFGPSGPLNGEPFIATFRFDLGAAPCSRSPFNTDCSGGLILGPPSPNLDARLLIGHGVLELIGSQDGEISATNTGPLNGSPFSELVATAAEDDVVLLGAAIHESASLLSFSASGANALLPAQVDQPFSADLSQEQASGRFFLHDDLYDYGNHSLTTFRFAFGQLRPLTITETIEPYVPPVIPPPEPVPEPVSWALIAAGVGVLGGAIRSRRFRLGRTARGEAFWRGRTQRLKLAPIAVRWR